MTQQPDRPLRKGKRAEKATLSDRRLTEAAIELLISRGIQGTTLQAVGQLAGYSRGLATHRFGSKAGLFGNLLKVASTDWLERVQEAVGAKVGAEALCAATDAAEQFIKDRPDEVRAMYILWFLSIDPSAGYHSNIGNVHRAQRRDVAEWIRAGQRAGRVDPAVDPLRVAEQYSASMAGIIYQWLANPQMPLHAMFTQLKADLRARLEHAGHFDAGQRARPTPRAVSIRR